jgi:hypothetical protein
MVLVVLAALVGVGRPGVLDVARPAASDGRPAPASAPVVACAPLDLSKAAPGSHVKAVATLGSTVATLEGTAGDAWGLPALGASALTIREGDVEVRTGTLHGPAGWEGPDGTVMLTGIQNPTATSPGGENAVLPLCVARFAGSQHAATLVGLYTGGAHCCTVVRSLQAVGPGAVAESDAQIGNPGVDVRALGDRAIVGTSDDVFNYEFNAFAYSGAPIKVLELRNGELADTTREHPDLVRADLDGWWKAFNDDAPDGLGFLAAWVADKCLLGEGPDGWATVDKLLAGGKLAGPSAAPGGSGTPALWPAGADYVAKLHAFLPQHGYCR